MDGQGNGSALVERHIASKKRLKIVRIVGPLVMVVTMVIGVWTIVDDVSSIDPEALIKAGQPKMQRLGTKVQDRLMAAVERLRPVVAKEFQTFQAEMKPRLGARFDKELSGLKANVEATLNGVLKNGMEKSKEDRRKALLEHFPVLKDDANAQNEILVSVADGGSAWARDQFAGSLSQHMKAMDSIRNTLDSKFTAEGEGSKGDPQRAIMAWLELMADTMGDGSNILGDEAPTDDGEKKKSKKAKKEG